MNSVKRILAAMLLGGAGLGLFVACGEVANNGAQDCTLDGDCPTGQACEAQICVDICETSADCAEGQVCEEGVNTSQLVCKSSGANNGTNNGVNNGTANNGTTNNGVNNGLLYYIIQIVDTSAGDEACGVSDPGSDIAGVELQSENGDSLAWGEIVWDELGPEANDYADTGILDGSPADVGADDCPSDFNDTTVVALGCGGWVAVEFKDSSGQPVALEGGAGQQVRVYEYGGVCSTGSTDDTYSVYICEDTAAIREGSDGSCTLDLTTGGSGVTTSPVSF